MFEKLRDYLSKKPTPNWIQQQGVLTKHTPDLWNLSQFRRQLYFSYGEDMPGYRDYEKLHSEEVQLHGSAYTAESLSVFVSDNGEEDSFPVALKEEFRYTSPYAAHTHLKGFLYGVRPEKIVDLDRYHENGKIFHRRRIWLNIPCVDGNSEGIQRVAAWTYIGIYEFWSELIDNGYRFKPAKLHNNLFIRDFYFYEGTHLDD